MNELKAVIVDDEFQARTTLRELLGKFCPEVRVIAEAGGFVEALDVLRSFQADILFLDIQMPDGSGFRVLEELAEHPFRIIFTTAYDQYAIRAIRFSALDYLLKPVLPEELKAAVKKAAELGPPKPRSQELDVLIDNIQSQEADRRIVVRTTEGMHVLPVFEIIRCESDDYYTHLFTSAGKNILVSKVLKEYDELLSPYGFLRVHKSHLVNPRHVERFVSRGGDHLVMRNGDKVPVSRRKKESVLEALRTV